jgi:hypothetical protein
MKEQKATVARSAAQLHATERSWVPQFNVEAAGYARGTGAETTGQRLAGTNGLAPNVQNYAAGVNITFRSWTPPASTLGKPLSRQRSGQTKQASDLRTRSWSSS